VDIGEWVVVSGRGVGVVGLWSSGGACLKVSEQAEEGLSGVPSADAWSASVCASQRAHNHSWQSRTWKPL